MIEKTIPQHQKLVTDKQLEDELRIKLSLLKKLPKDALSFSPQDIEMIRATHREIRRLKLILASNWETGLRRIIRRNSISEALRGKKKLSEIIEFTRSHEKAVGTEILIDQLANSEYLLFPKISEVATAVYERLKVDFPNLEAVVLMGSGIHGGAATRQMLFQKGNINGIGDFDWSIISTQPLTEEEAKQLCFTADPIIREEGKNKQIKMHNGYPELSECFFLDPRQIREISLLDLDEAYNLITDKRPQTANIQLSNIESMMLYFMPSFPPEVNMKNRQMLLEALRKLARTDKPTWDKLIHDLLAKWEDYHSISEKHLLINPNQDKPKDIWLKTLTLSRIRAMMVTSMRVLLESTGIDWHST